jgi:ATP-dependent DNA ligase
MLARVVEALQAQYQDCEVRMVASLPATTESIESCLEQGFEGAMLKKLDGRYEAGKRSTVWLKVKAFSTADAFVVGYNPGENANEGLVGSLNLAVLEPLPPEEVPDPDLHVDINGVWHRARPVAQVGNLTLEMRKAISAEDGSLRAEVYGTVIEWQAQGIGKNGRARHAHMVRIRPDKSVDGCMVDQLDVFAAV